MAAPWETMGDIFKESKGIFLNSVGIQTNLGMIYRNVVTTTAYCDSSKVVTDILCGYHPEKYKALDMVGFMKIQRLIKAAGSITKEMQKNYNAVDVLKEQAKKLADNIDGISAFNSKNQESFLCNAAKGVTHSVCQMNYFWRKALTGDFSIGMIDFRQMAWIINQIIHITDAVLKGEEFDEEGTVNNIMDVKNNYDKLDILNNFALRLFNQDEHIPTLEDITQFKFEPEEQEGGSYRNPFNYIVDPLTDTPWNINSIKGTQILNNYRNYK
jgi:hypothetical protein